MIPGRLYREFSLSSIVAVSSTFKRSSRSLAQLLPRPSDADSNSYRYTIRELQSDIEKQLSEVGDPAERERLSKETKLGIFVVHNKYAHPTTSGFASAHPRNTDANQTQIETKNRHSPPNDPVFLRDRDSRRLARLPVGMRWGYRGA